ncbi:MAG: acetyl-CoA carboxylase, carboxyltransferase subunit beta [Syntrophomonadaceae bacterium]|jgi:acetyl-CoA carboxylase carboxyl transferase subunit beta
MFGKKKFIPIKPQVESWTCPTCGEYLPTSLLSNHKGVCPKCKHNLTLGAYERIELLTDPQSFRELDADLVGDNILDFPGYDEKLDQARQNSGLAEAVVTGTASLGGYQIVLAVMDSNFMMGSMGVIVGEKICRAVDKAIELEWPLIIFSTSGGARMQEGIFSLMQMAKTSAALERLREKGLLYISVLTNPTTGGVLASFASLGDIIIAEPGALLGFTGPRVITQTIGERLPDNFQRAGFLMEHGMLDMVVERSAMRDTLILLLKLHNTPYLPVANQVGDKAAASPLTDNEESLEVKGGINTETLV